MLAVTPVSCARVALVIPTRRALADLFFVAFRMIQFMTWSPVVLLRAHEHHRVRTLPSTFPMVEKGPRVLRPG